MAKAPPSFSSVADRLSRLESRISVLLTHSRRFEEQFQAQDRQRESLSSRLSSVEHKPEIEGLSSRLAAIEQRLGPGTFDALESGLNALRADMEMRDEYLTATAGFVRDELNTDIHVLNGNLIDVTSCPNHRTIVHRIPSPGIHIRCQHCNLIFCSACRKWHENTCDCNADPLIAKRCPFCTLPVVKVLGSDHIACRCRKHWCFACRFGAHTGREIEVHMHQVHKGGF
jgi:hypothetical protein